MLLEGDGRNFLRKRMPFDRCKKIDYHNASQWLADQVSPVVPYRIIRRTVIPNGIDRTIFCPQSAACVKSIIWKIRKSSSELPMHGMHARG